MSSPRHFLTLNDISRDEFHALIHRAIELKALHRTGKSHATLPGKVMAMIFAKAATNALVIFKTVQFTLCTCA